MNCFSWAITKHRLCACVGVFVSVLLSCRVEPGAGHLPVVVWRVAVTISIGDLAVQRRDSRRLAPSRRLGRAAIHICRYGDEGWHLFHGRSTRTRSRPVVEMMLHHGCTAPRSPGREGAQSSIGELAGLRARGRACHGVWLSVCLLVRCPLSLPAHFALDPRWRMARFPGAQ